MQVDSLAERLGLSVPDEWWASPAMLKSLEAAGFALAQVHAPPVSVLSDRRLCTIHASALAGALATTGLRPVLHAPCGLRMGTPAGDRAADGLISYASEIDATHVVYHACAHPNVPGSEESLHLEAASLAALAPRAARLGVVIAIENLAPVFPGPEPVSAHPMALRSLAQRIGSDRVGLCLDLGHAHIVAQLRHTSLEALVEPVLDLVTLFHLHDNLGARAWPPQVDGGLDPLRLDLHLPPGRGSLPWTRVLARVAAHPAPAVLEVHPPHRRRAAEIHRSFIELLEDREPTAIAA
jgi:sugar phosphate isomerase/epimerase